MSPGRPSREQLQAFLLGKGTAEEQAAVAAYVVAHPEALAELSRLESEEDALISELRQPPVAETFTEEPAFRQGLRQAKSVRRAASRDRPGIAGYIPAGRIGRYRLLAPLGRRGSGNVYLAEDGESGRRVALKLLPPDRAFDPGAVARFRREREWLARLDDPHVVRVIESGEAGGVPYFVMELLEGLDLSALVERAGPLPVAAACELIRQAALGLQYAFEKGLVHRDIKPSNLFLTVDGRVKLLDLGLARPCPLAAEEASLTESGQLVGTLDYMAPEQAFDTRAVDIRADIYGLGCTLYKLLAGLPPFGGAEYRHLLKKALAHAQKPVPPVGERRPDVPLELSIVLDRALAKEPEQRYATPQELADALTPFTAGARLVSLARPFATTADREEGAPETTSALGAANTDLPRLRGRRALPTRLLWFVAVLLGTAVVALLAVSVTRLNRAGSPEAQPDGTNGIPRNPADPSVTATPEQPADLGRQVLVPNGDFEAEAPFDWPPGWPPQLPNSVEERGVFVRSTRKAFRGAASAEAIARRDLANQGFAHISNYLPVVRGRKYVLSAWFNTEGMTTGNLYVDLAQTGFNVIVLAERRRGWHCVWKEFTPNVELMRIRLVRDGVVKGNERGYIDCVSMTPAEEFAPPPMRFDSTP